jgi:hypothetical protein
MVLAEKGMFSGHRRLRLRGNALSFSDDGFVVDTRNVAPGKRGIFRY